MQTSTVSDRGRTYCRAERYCHAGTGFSARPAYAIAAIAASPANPCIADTSSIPGASYPRAPVIHITPVILIAPTFHDVPTTHVTSTTPANHAVSVIAAKHPPRQCRTETCKTLCGVDDTADSDASSTTAYILRISGGADRGGCFAGSAFICFVHLSLCPVSGIPVPMRTGQDS